MNNPEVAIPITAVFGALAPILISLLKSANAPAIFNVTLALVVSFGGGLLSVFITVGFSFDELTVPYILGLATAVFTISQIIYRLYFAEFTSGQRLESTLRRVLWGEPK